jgi:hypothetical protein
MGGTVRDPIIAVEEGRILGVAVPLRLILDRTLGCTNTTTPVQVLSDRVQAGEWWVLDFVSLYNQSGESVTAQWCIKSLGGIILVSSDITIADGKADNTNTLPIIHEEEQFGVLVTGTAKKGTVTLVLCAHAIPYPA